METAARMAFYFFMYSCAGWVIESIYCSVAAKKWINRGFLTGPLCPIYGTGAVVLAVLVNPLKEYLHARVPDGFGYDLLAFAAVVAAGMVLCDIVEFITSVLLEKMFHARWWDYSNKLLNIQGRICLMHTVYWGIATAAFLYLVHPLVDSVGRNIPARAIYLSLLIILAVFAVDLFNAVKNAMDVKKLMDRMRLLSDKVSRTAAEFKSNAGELYDALQENAAKGRDRFKSWRSDTARQINEFRPFAEFSLKEKLGEIKPGSKQFNRLLRGYPNIRLTMQRSVKKLDELVSELKGRITDSEEEMF